MKEHMHYVDTVVTDLQEYLNHRPMNEKSKENTNQFIKIF